MKKRGNFYNDSRGNSDHFKNGANPKNLTSRGISNKLPKMTRLRLFTAIMAISLMATSCNPDPLPIRVSDVSLPSFTSLTAGNTLSLTAEVWPENAVNKNVTWSSSNTARAIVSSTGGNTAKITVPSGAKAGFVNITAITEDGNYEATCEVMVSTLPSDGSWTAYKTHTVGKGIDLVFLGDGYSASDITGGKYDKDMKTAIDGFFEVQPYKTYKNYFNVYIVVAESGDSGISTISEDKDTKFATRYISGSSNNFWTDNNWILSYANKTPINIYNNDATVVLILNIDYVWAGLCYIGVNKPSLAICPAHQSELKGLVQHEAGGHGFGQLADEYSNSGSTPSESDKSNFRQSQQQHGFYLNVDLTNNPTTVLWKDFLGNPKYPMVGFYEGAYNYKTGFWRSEDNSCMRNSDVPYYSAPSRALIVKRIKTLAGEPFTLEWFMSTDIIEPYVTTKSSTELMTRSQLASPIVW